MPVCPKVANYANGSRISFDGGNLSSDTGLLLPRSFDQTMGFSELIEKYFSGYSANEHTDADIIKQLIYTNIAGYHQDDACDELREDPIFKEVLAKDSLASQPTVSRRINEFSEDNLEQFNSLMLDLLKKVYKYQTPSHVVLDIDSTHVETHGNQEENAYNFHYHAKGYHPLMLFDGLTGDLLRAKLRKGSVYTSDGVVEFLQPVLQWFEDNFPEVKLILRGDSGFACPELYQLLEEYRVYYVIRLKANNLLYKAAYQVEEYFYETFGQNYFETNAVFDSFPYQAASWHQERRVICKVERKAGELYPRHHFIVTNLNSPPKQVFGAYQKRGHMENYVKEAKLDFAMDQLSHTSFVANSIKFCIKALAYNLINFMKRLVLPKEQQRNRMVSLRYLLIKVASKFTRSGRYKKISICSSYPYKSIFNKALQAISNL